MKKRILSCLMALALCLTLLPGPALAAEGEPGEVQETLKAASSTPRSKEIAIPEAKTGLTYNGKEQMGVADPGENAGISVTKVPNNEEVPDEMSYGDSLTVTAKAKDAGENGKWTWKTSDSDSLKIERGEDTETVKVRALKSTGNATLTVTYKFDSTEGTWSKTINFKKQDIRVDNIKVKEKEYDGGTSATLDTSGANYYNAVYGYGKLQVEYVSGATFVDANVGKDKEVTVPKDALKLIGDNSEHFNVTSWSGPLSKPFTGTITPATLTIKSVTLAAKTYDGNTDAKVEGVTFTGMKNNETLDQNDYTATGEFDSAKAGDNKSVTVTVTLNNNDTTKNYTLAANGVKTVDATITKANQEKPILTISSAQALVGDKSVPTLTASGGKTGSYTYTSSKPDVATVDNTGRITILKAGETTFTVKSSGNENYNESAESNSVSLKVLNRITLTVTDTKATTEELKAHLKNQGAITVGQPQRKDGTNDFTVEVKGNRALTEYASSNEAQGTHKWIGLLIGQFTVNGGAAANLTTLKYASGEAYTAYASFGEQDVKDAAPVGGDGTQFVLWIKTDDGKTRVIHLQDQDGNEAHLTINFTKYTTPVAPPPSSGSTGGGSSSGGGGGGSSSSSKPSTSTGTTTRPDGTKVQTETKKDGTKIQTETKKDGSVTKTTTNPNGSSVTETKAADGSTGTVKTDKNGQTTAETTLSSKAIEDAKKNGEAVKAPVEVEASRNSNTAPTVKIELPRNSGDTKVEIPVTNVKPGTVAVLVHPDGTEEIVKNSLPTEDGIQLTVNSGATVKIVDNSKDFVDTRSHWAKDAIDFVSARGLVNGMNDFTYAPNNSTTRAQLWTILARQNDADLTGGATWFENAQNWAKAKGISDGANPNGTINRAQMVTMLWRAMGQPATASGASFADVPADSYYAQAVAWAIENGITTGVGNGRFDPNSTCTRAQIATFLYRYMK